MPIIPKAGGGGPPLSDATPLADSGSGASGSSTDCSRSDHVHPASAGGANIKNIYSQRTGGVNDSSTAGQVPVYDATFATGSLTIAANSVQAGTQFIVDMNGILDFGLTESGQTITLAQAIDALGLSLGTIVIPQQVLGAGLYLHFRSIWAWGGSSADNMNVTAYLRVELIDSTANTVVWAHVTQESESGMDMTVDNTFILDSKFATASGLSNFTPETVRIDQYN